MVFLSFPQGEEGDQGSPGDVGSQGPTVRHCSLHCIRVFQVTISPLLYQVRQLLFVFVISGSSGNTRSNRNDRTQGGDGKYIIT